MCTGASAAVIGCGKETRRSLEHCHATAEERAVVIDYDFDPLRRLDLLRNYEVDLRRRNSRDQSGHTRDTDFYSIKFCRSGAGRRRRGQVCALSYRNRSGRDEVRLETRPIGNIDDFFQRKERDLRFIAFDVRRQRNDAQIKIRFIRQILGERDIDLIEAGEVGLRTDECRAECNIADLDLKAGSVAPPGSV